MKPALLVVFAFLAIGTRLAAQQPATPTIRSLMTVEEFQKAGLQKLSASELEALDSWFGRIAVRLLASGISVPNTQSRSAGSTALDFAYLEGAIIVADDGEFLGKITTNQFDSQSIGNEVGRFGSEVSRTSIFNEVGRYGGEVARMSPFNSVTSVPPRIFRGDRFIAYLTVNTVKSPRIDPRALIGWIKANH